MSIEDRLKYWQRRARDAEHRVEFEREATESAHRWGVREAVEADRLRERCTYLYDIAARLGATREELHGPDIIYLSVPTMTQDEREQVMVELEGVLLAVRERNRQWAEARRMRDTILPLGAGHAG